jgi:glycosyltransferase involved in cell wall biosynthesis
MTVVSSASHKVERSTGILVHREDGRAGSATHRMMLNICYEEPDNDRWLPMDRYPRRLVRRLWRGRPRPGGHKRIFLNLCAGLDRLGVRYRVNAYRYLKRNPNELACIIGKPLVLDKMEWKNPILFGGAVHSHPLDDPGLHQRRPIRKVLVPGTWMKEMCKPYWGDAVEVWPVGIDTDLWRPVEPARKATDVLLYDKVRWEHEHYERLLIAPIRNTLRKRGHSVLEIRYGSYCESDFHAALARCRTMIFLCEHETQGIAYQQAMSCNVPILAWDRGGFWQDPSYYPDKVEFKPVTSVPYWSGRCGRTFVDFDGFAAQWARFWEESCDAQFAPRAYVLGTLTLEQSARRYLEFVDEIATAQNMVAP